VVLIVVSLLVCRPAVAVSISGFAPLFGQPGNIVTVTGSGFTSATLVQFDNLTAADFNVASDTQIAVVVPQGAASGPLSVTAAGATASSSSSFLVAPTITGFTPASGASPTQIAISGANFIAGATTVTFSGTNPPVNGIVVALTQVNAVVPVGAADGPITVTTSAGSATSAARFVVSQLPVITGFSPSAGTNGTTVVIDGSNFITNGILVKFGSVAASQVAVVASTELQAVAPPGTVSAPITVSTTYGSFTTSSNFVTGSGPAITDFSPIDGAALTYVTIDGFNFSTVTNVVLGGVSVPAAAFTEFTDTQMQLAVPTGASTGPITLRGSQGSFTTSSNFVTGAGPIITDFSPVLGAPGTQVTIDGLNFGNVTNVKFGGASVAITPTAYTQVIATVPSGATTGPVTVASPSGSFTTSSNFTITTGGPFISGFSPSNGVRGMTVTITGGSFTNLASPAVEFNGVAATITAPTSTSTLEATVPANATSGPITVLNKSGAISSSGLFYLQPWITNFIPASGVANATITINGRNLTNAGAVTVNGVSYNFIGAATQIVATVPTNATTGLLTIATPGGVIISTNAFTVLPNIYSLSPALGPVGTVVTITGTSLFNVTNVQFNGASAAPFNVSAGQLQATVPAGATNGPIRVVTQYGSATSSNSFTVTGPSLLLLTKTAAPQILIGGGDITYTLMVTNEGPSIVTGVTVTDNFPTSVTFLSATSTAGACSYTNGVVTCNIGVLDTNASVTISIEGAAASAGASTNTASLSFVEGNLNPSYDSASAAAYLVSSAQATLNIALQSNAAQAVIWWPVSAVNFVLQSNVDLGQTNAWQTSSITPFLTNGVNYATNNLTAQPVFFRLKSQ
jgi:uncharacterized repeat protein (TIGR01451 family)